MYAAYEGLLATIGAASNKDNASVEWAVTPVQECFSLDKEGNVVFEEYLHLRKWKERRDSKKVVSILVKATEKIRRSDRVLVSSTVRVSYYRVAGEAAQHVLSLHFDYDQNPTHPVFHAQVTDEQLDVPAKEARALGLNYDRQQTNVVCLRNARIPTCDMTLPSVLLCLAADHLSLGPKDFSDLIGTIKRLQQQLPRPDITKMKTCMTKEPGHLCSSLWFAQRA